MGVLRNSRRNMTGEGGIAAANEGEELKNLPLVTCSLGTLAVPSPLLIPLPDANILCCVLNDA